MEDKDKVPVGYNKAYSHLVFDDRMTLENKDGCFKDGNRNPELEWSTFAGVVSRYVARIALTYASMNDLPTCACDVQNDNFQEPSSEKHHFLWSKV